MSTQVEEHATHWVVSTVEAPGNRRRISRTPVAIPKGDRAALSAEITKQAEAARQRAGIDQTPKEPVA